MAKLIRAIMNHSDPITAAIYKDLTTPRVIRNQKAKPDRFGPEYFEVAYALRWNVKYYYSTQVIAHDGIICGYGSRLCLLPEHKVGAYIVSNSASTFGLSAVIQNEIIEEVLGTLSGDTNFQGYMIEEDGEAGVVPVFSQLDSAQHVVGRGVALEEALGQNHLLWFHRP